MSERSTMGLAAIQVLLVEDSLVDAELVRAHLGTQRHPIFVIDAVESVAEAVTRLRAAPPDVVLLDLNLPDSQGLETLYTVKANARDLPIIVLTNADDVEMAVRAVEKGAQDYLYKVDLRGDLLARSIHYAITRKRIERELASTVEDLRRALEEVRQLKGLLPICSLCKRIRDDGGYWQQVEVYIGEHSDASFTHSLCPTCYRERYPQIYYKHHDPSSDPDSSGQ